MINEVLYGDCLDILKQLPRKTIDMVYLDPPFYTQSKQTLKSRANKEYSYSDSWDSIQSYIIFLGERLHEIRRVMKDDSVIFLHCDRHASHRIRVLLDEVFGYERFVSEIIWTYRRWSTSKKSLLGSHQTILMYAKTAKYKFNEILQDYSETTNLDQILQRRERNSQGKSTYSTDSHGRTILQGPKRGVPLSDTWDIPYLNPKARERCGYPTQKPLRLLERIVLLASNEDDLVLDPFCGSGTTLVAATLLNRNFLGIDSYLAAVELSRQRVQNPVRSESRLLDAGRDAFRKLPAEVVQILSELPVKLVQRNRGIDAIHDQFIDGRPVVLRVQRPGEDLTDAAYRLQRAGRKKNAALLILIRTQMETCQHSFFDIVPEDVRVIDSLQVSVQSQLSTNSHR